MHETIKKELKFFTTLRIAAFLDTHFEHLERLGTVDQLRDLSAEANVSAVKEALEALDSASRRLSQQSLLRPMTEMGVGKALVARARAWKQTQATMEADERIVAESVNRMLVEQGAYADNKTAEELREALSEGLFESSAVPLACLLYTSPSPRDS